MSEMMLHRVARAIMQAGTGCNVIDWREAEWNPHIAQVLAEARAAIEEMREPDKAMLHACARAMSPDRRPTPERVSVKQKHRIRYQAMIDAALFQHKDTA